VAANERVMGERAGAQVDQRHPWTLGRGLAVLALAVILVGVALAAMVDITYSSSEPLRVGSAGFWGQASTCPDESDDAEEECRWIRYVAGEGYTFGLSVRNGSPFSLVILGVAPTDPDVLFLWRLDDVELLRDETYVSTDPARTVPFARFTLGPGDERFMVFRGRFAPCELARDHYEPGSGIGLPPVTLENKLFFTTHLQRLDIGQAIVNRPATLPC
jgi:hypothetical protein